MLERDRLALRAVRLRSIVNLLRRQAAKHLGQDTPPVRARSAAIASYEDELVRIRARLEQIARNS